jgi:hypothetical protein
VGRDYAGFASVNGYVFTSMFQNPLADSQHTGGFIFGYDTGQISDIVLMDDFLLRFAKCTTPGDVSTCAFSVVREGLIVSLLSIGTLFGALFGAP